MWPVDPQRNRDSAMPATNNHRHRLGVSQPINNPVIIGKKKRRECVAPCFLPVRKCVASQRMQAYNQVEGVRREQGIASSVSEPTSTAGRATTVEFEVSESAIIRRTSPTGGASIATRAHPVAQGKAVRE